MPAKRPYSRWSASISQCVPPSFSPSSDPAAAARARCLNIIAGLEAPTTGHVLVDGVAVPDRQQYFGYMFQKDLLFPWRRVCDNVAIGIEVLGTPRAEARARALDILRRFDLDAFAEEVPGAALGRDAPAGRVDADAPVRPRDPPARRAVRRARCPHTLHHAGMAARHLGDRAPHRHLHHPRHRGSGIPLRSNSDDVRTAGSHQGRGDDRSAPAARPYDRDQATLHRAQAGGSRSESTKRVSRQPDRTDRARSIQEHI